VFCVLCFRQEGKRQIFDVPIPFIRRGLNLRANNVHFMPQAYSKKSHRSRAIKPTSTINNIIIEHQDVTTTKKSRSQPSESIEE